jgi:uncharacterized protein YbjT (DUF2867 family)
MSIKEQIAIRPRVLILGATGRIGSKVIAELERIDPVRVVYIYLTRSPSASGPTIHLSTVQSLP